MEAVGFFTLLMVWVTACDCHVHFVRQLHSPRLHLRQSLGRKGAVSDQLAMLLAREVSRE
jgi:hypothetical protein